MAAAGRLDQEAVATVLSAAGHPVRRARTNWPAGLTEREVEVLRMICRGGTKNQVAKVLSIATSTVDHISATSTTNRRPVARRCNVVRTPTRSPELETSPPRPARGLARVRLP
jgi:FixJ family two-component response regulator